MSNTTIVVAGAGAGTGPPAPVLFANSTDERGIISFGTGTTPAAGTMVTVTFASNLSGYDDELNVGGWIVISPQNAVTAALQLCVLPSGQKLLFSVGCAVAPAASQGSGTYSFSYNVLV